jgi:predicted HicB family RNase H-like nuclease
MPKSQFDPNAAFKSIVGVDGDAPQASAVDEGRQEGGQASGGAFVIEGARGKAETRSKRINLAVTPSAYEAARRKCKALGISMNECVNQFFEKWGGAE